jgi:hypothetical protein
MNYYKIPILFLFIMFFSTLALANENMEMENTSGVSDTETYCESCDNADALITDEEIPRDDEETVRDNEESIDSDDMDSYSNVSGEEDDVDMWDLSLTTETLVDTDSEFEAILLDEETQETIGHLFWGQSDGEGKIEFNYAGIEDQVLIQISDLEAMESSERQDVLLRGLYESGVVWLSQHENGPFLVVSDDEEPGPTLDAAHDITPSMTALKWPTPIGYFDGIQPKFIEYRSNRRRNVTRVARGWAYDEFNPPRSIWVHLYSGNKYVGSTFANVSRPDVNRKKGVRGNHGWRFRIPEAWDADEIREKQGSCRRFLNSVQCRRSFKAFGESKYLQKKLHKLKGGHTAFYDRRL